MERWRKNLLEQASPIYVIWILGCCELETKKYKKNSPYFLVQKKLMELLDEIFVESGEKEIPVVILA